MPLVRSVRYRRAKLHLTGESVVLLGSGGAARAIAFALASGTEIRRLHLLGIEEQERRTLASDLKIRLGSRLWMLTSTRLA